MKRRLFAIVILAWATGLGAQAPVSNIVALDDGQFAILRCDGSSGSNVRLSIVIAASRDRAEAALAKLRGGEPFQSVARQYSSHPSKDAGGVLPALEVGDLRKEFQAALKDLGPCMVRPSPTAAAGPRGDAAQEFIIADERFVDRSSSGKPSKASAEASNGKVLWNVSPEKGEVIEIVNGKDTLWGNGSIHTWVGDGNEIYGHVISSDQKDPLQFRVDAKKGYVYLRGNGTVKLPTGEIKRLPPAPIRTLSAQGDWEGAAEFGGVAFTIALTVSGDSESIASITTRATCKGSAEPLLVVALKKPTKIAGGAFAFDGAEAESEFRGRVQVNPRLPPKGTGTFLSDQEAEGMYEGNASLQCGDALLKVSGSWKAKRKAAGAPSRADSSQPSRLLLEAVRKGDVAATREQLEKGASVDAMDETGMAPLHLAAVAGHEAVTEALLAAGAKVNQSSKSGWFPLHLAALGGHTGVARLLLANGADVNVKGNAPEQRGASPLHVAAVNGHRELAELLLEQGADVNAKKEGGTTPLHWVASSGQTRVAQLLISKGADVNAKDTDGWTPLRVANANDNKDIAAILQKAGGRE